MNEKSYLSHLSKRRTLTVGDKITLMIFLLTNVACAIIPHASIENSHKTTFTISIFTSYTTFYLINTTSFANRFTNSIFSFIWVILCVCFVSFGLQAMIIFNCVPLLEFLLYQLLRFFFWRSYGNEFIPADVNKINVLDHYNEVEERSNTNEDKRYMQILLWTGMAILIACSCSMIGIRF